MCAAAVSPSEPTLGEGVVRIAPGVLEQLRDQVLDGYAAAPHGGIELGFVLFGHAKECEVFIEHFRLIPCSHLLSPRFLLSPDEEKEFPEWLENLSADPELQSSEIVGWGCSHHRCDLALLDREINFHRRYFGQKNQTVMIVKPENMQAILAGIFLLGADGAIEPDHPMVQLRSAVLDSVSGNRAKLKEDSLAHHTHMSEGGPRSSEPDAKVNRISHAERALLPMISPSRKLLAIADEPAVALTGIEKADKPSSRPFFSAWRLAVAAGITVLAVALSVVFAVGWSTSKVSAGSTTLSVGIRPQATTLVFSWKGNINHARSATIEILDGDVQSHYDITGWFQSAGAFAFPHKTGNVQAVLTVLTPTGGKLTRSIDFLDGRTSPKPTN